FRDLATRKLVVTGISEHPDVREERLSRPRPDPRALRTDASNRLVAWRRDHRCESELEALRKVGADGQGAPGTLTAAAIAAARAGATLGQISAALNPLGVEPARVKPLEPRTYAAAYEELRAAADAHAERTGQRPRIFLANFGTPAEFIARSTYAVNF